MDSAAPALFFVNVGMFANDKSANEALSKLRKTSLPVNVQAINTNRGTRTRVRVGPFDSEMAADKAAASVRALALEADVSRQ
jgi:general secretion pathway protein D